MGDGILTISVVLATYRGAEYLAEFLESLETQLLPPDELIAVDDASGDETLSILQAFAARASFPVQILENKQNLGSVSTFARALDVSKCDVIAFADQDDVWKPTKLKLMAAVFQAEPDIELCFCDGEVVDARLTALGYSLWQSVNFNKKERLLFQSGYALNVLLRKPVVTGAAMALRSRNKALILPFPEDWVHDEWAAVLLAVTGKLACLNEKLIQYRQHGANQIGAEKSSLGNDIDKSQATGAQAYNTELKRWQKLAERLKTNSKTIPDLLQGKIDFLETRHKIYGSRIRGKHLVLGEFLKGNYRRYASGWKSLLKDFTH